MKLWIFLSALTVTLLTLGVPTIAHTVEEAYHDIKLLQGTCFAVKQKLCAITPENAEGGAQIILRCLKKLNHDIDFTQTRIPKTEPFPPKVKAEIDAGVKIFNNCLVEILSIYIPKLLAIDEIKHDSYQFLGELDTLIHQEEYCLSGDFNGHFNANGHIDGGIGGEVATR